MIKKLGMVLLGVTLLLGIAACADTAETEAAGVYVSVDINPSIEFIVDEEDIVATFNFTNEDAEILCADIDFIGMNIEEAVELFVELATEAGFIDVDGVDNAVLITVLGDENDELVEGIKERVRTRVMRYMAMHYINGQVFTEEFTQADIVAQANELGVTPGKLKLALLAQTVDAELVLEDAIAMTVKDLLEKVKTQHQANISELTQEELTLRIAQKEVLMTLFRAKLTENIQNKPELTEVQIQARVEAIRSQISTQTRQSWEERLDDWRAALEQRQLEATQSQNN